jgi:predicted dehydrogenase/threonine dehydrogenase-like Zn-dependent dehydrogenase
MGYCHVGKVLDTGNTSYSLGDRIVSNANHGDVARVPFNLTAKIPPNVDDEAATFTVMGSIALQGVRLISPTLGETVVVTGLGLVGLLAVQILKANGCRVIGIDIDSSKCKLAKGFGAEVVNISQGEDPLEYCNEATKNLGVDAVLITASTKSNDVMHQSASLCRKRGKIVLIGVVGLDLKREDFYEKELTFQVSCSYGPGRYEENYENQGMDYPIGFVRWTEKRNFETILELLSSGLINTKPLITHRFKLDEVKEAYETLDDEKALGILLKYEDKIEPLEETSKIIISENSIPKNKSNVCVSFLGAGNYASRFLIPNFKKNKAILKTIVTSEGSNGVHSAKKFGFEIASTNIQDALTDETDTLVIATRHDLHAEQLIAGLEEGKNIFIEKPLAINHAEIKSIESTYAGLTNKPLLMVGFNRRFSSHIQKMKSLLGTKKSPKCFVFTMNAGYLPDEHWTQNKDIGGGRIIGEACHYLDLMRYLSGSTFKSWSAIKANDKDKSSKRDDRAIINLEFENGSIGSIHYFSNGGPSQKERIEVFCGNSTLQLNNFKELIGHGWEKFKSYKTYSQDKGQETCVKEFLDSVKNNSLAPISFEEIIEVSKITIDIAESLRS